MLVSTRIFSAFFIGLNNNEGKLKIEGTEIEFIGSQSSIISSGVIDMELDSLLLLWNHSETSFCIVELSETTPTSDLSTIVSARDLQKQLTILECSKL